MRPAAILAAACAATVCAPGAGAREVSTERMLAIFRSVDRLIDCASYQDPSGRLGCERARSRYAACAVESELFEEARDCANDRWFVSRMQEAREAEARYRAGRWPDVRPGMTKTQVVQRSKWGPPLWKTTAQQRGRALERWVYGAGRYLDFERGRVTVIQAGD